MILRKVVLYKLEIFHSGMVVLAVALFTGCKLEMFISRMVVLVVALFTGSVRKQ